MSLPSQIIVTQNKFKKLFAVTKWMEQMPNFDDFDVGDSFMQNVREFQCDQMVELTQSGGSDHYYYVSYFELNDQDQLFVFVGDEDDPSKDAVKIEVVCQ